MARGDHIRVVRNVYSHHGIDCGDGTVIHYTGDLSHIRDARVERTGMAVFRNGDQVDVVEHPRGFDADTTIRRARSRIGETAYNLGFNNCEHFARWCKTGEHASQQAELVSALALGPLASMVIVDAGNAIAAPDEVSRQRVLEKRAALAAAAVFPAAGLALAIRDSFRPSEQEPRTESVKTVVSKAAETVFPPLAFLRWLNRR